MSNFSTVGGGITKLSQLIIDVDKDWQVKGISNLKELALGMVQGDVIVRGPGGVLVRIPAGPANMVFTSAGPGNMPYWGPGGLYLWRYFPVTIFLNGPTVAKNTTRSHTTARGMPISSVHVDATGDLPASMLKLLTPAITLPHSAAKNTTRSHTQGETPPVTRAYDTELVVASAQAEDTPLFTDETVQAQSEITRYENYTTGEDNYNTMTAAIWQAQTFTPATAHYIRRIWVKLYGPLPGTATMSIRATAGGLPTGADLAVATLTDVIGVTSGNPRWYCFEFTGANIILLNAATVYAMCLRQDGSGTLGWRCDATAPAYAGGQRCYSNDTGGSWSADASRDFMFEEWGVVSPPDMHLFPAAIALNDAYYFGFPSRFGVLVVDVGQAGAGTYTVAWEYSLGAAAWAACVGLVDGSNGFRNQWWREVSHTPQAGWAVDTVNGIANMYWLRCRCTNPGAGYSQPLGDFAKVRITV